MSLFDFSKKESGQSKEALEKRNAEYLAMRDQEVQRLNNAYDFNSIDGITAIPVPCKEVNGSSFTGRVEYYLRGQCFAKYWGAGERELALACLRKAQELMYISDIIWKKDDFMRLVCYLRIAGKSDEADAEEKRIIDFFQNQNLLRDKMERELESARFLETDLIEFTASGICCAECAKYRHRIYSISGKDKRFPELPMMFLPNTFDYNHTCLSFWSFTEGISEPQFQANGIEQIIKYSNRPFEDNRTKVEIERYENWKREKREKEERDAMFRKEAEENSKRIEEIRKEFVWIQENLPDLCPKSLSGYSRMKNANSATYQKITAAAARKGKNL